MATERRNADARVGAQASVLKSWGQSWRRMHGTSQQDLGRAAGYGSEVSPKSAAVAISRIESGKTEPTGRYRRTLLEVLGRTEAELQEATERAIVDRSRSPLARAMAGPIPVENEVRRAHILASSTALTQRVAFQSETAEQVFERTRGEFILPFLEYAATVDWRPLRAAADDPRRPVPDSTPTPDVRELRRRTQGSVLQAMGEDAGGGVTGSAAGVFAAVSASATASTGAAIASLSGAASSATLARLAGGSLSGGALGVAGGTAVLTGVVATPALLVLGAVLVWKGRRLRRDAEAEAEKLDAAQQALEEMAEAVERAQGWHDAQQDVIQLAGLVGRTIHARLVDPVSESGSAPGSAGAGGKIGWDRLPDGLREALQVELQLVSIILDARALPIWLGVASVGEPDPTDTHEETAARWEEWIRESLALAQDDLRTDEEWLRNRLAQPRG